MPKKAEKEKPTEATEEKTSNNPHDYYAMTEQLEKGLCLFAIEKTEKDGKEKKSLTPVAVFREGTQVRDALKLVEEMDLSADQYALVRLYHQMEAQVVTKVTVKVLS